MYAPGFMTSMALGSELVQETKRFFEKFILTFNSLQQILNTVRIECIPISRVIFPADGRGACP